MKYSSSCMKPYLPLTASSTATSAAAISQAGSGTRSTDGASRGRGACAAAAGAAASVMPGSSMAAPPRPEFVAISGIHRLAPHENTWLYSSDRPNHPFIRPLGNYPNDGQKRFTIRLPPVSRGGKPHHPARGPATIGGHLLQDGDRGADRFRAQDERGYPMWSHAHRGSRQVDLRIGPNRSGWYVFDRDRSRGRGLAGILRDARRPGEVMNEPVIDRPAALRESLQPQRDTQTRQIGYLRS